MVRKYTYLRYTEIMTKKLWFLELNNDKIYRKIRYTIFPLTRYHKTKYCENGPNT